MTAEIQPTLRIKRQTTTLRQQVLEALRNAILDFQFKPGARLVERELCAMTGVSRTSVREALRHLESEGLVENVAQRGPTVATLTIEDARQIYEVRSALEGLAGALFAARASDAQRHALVAQMRKLEEAFASGDRRRIRQQTSRYYDVLLEGSGNRFVGDMIRGLQARVTFLRATSMSHPDRAPASLAEMQRITKAIQKRDPKAAEAACRAHIEAARDAALAMLAKGIAIPAR
ncbi:MAG TPA: GntR family transcriptional regulator [Stellaceae bacterium]|nr:GntR family transcriptional regulator [Stellaceae bacterium]